MSIRPATVEDMDGIMRVEQSWPESARASREVLLTRLEKFPEGFLVATHDEIVVATLTACLIHYDPNHPQKLSNWGKVTNNGLLHDQHQKEEHNALYIVSGVVDKSYSGKKDLFSESMMQQYALAKKLGMDYMLGGSVIPGYKRYIRSNPGISAEEYVMTRKSEKPVDPLLCKYHLVGFEVPDRHHVIKNYFPDESSKNYAAIVVRKVE